MGEDAEEILAEGRLRLAHGVTAAERCLRRLDGALPWSGRGRIPGAGAKPIPVPPPAPVNTPSREGQGAVDAPQEEAVLLLPLRARSAARRVTGLLPAGSDSLE